MIILNLNLDFLINSQREILHFKILTPMKIFNLRAKLVKFLFAFSLVLISNLDFLFRVYLAHQFYLKLFIVSALKHYMKPLLDIFALLT